MKMRVVFGSRGWPNGMVHLLVGAVCLLVSFAKQPVGLKGMVARLESVRFTADRQACGYGVSS